MILRFVNINLKYIWQSFLQEKKVDNSKALLNAKSNFKTSATHLNSLYLLCNNLWHYKFSYSKFIKKKSTIYKIPKCIFLYYLFYLIIIGLYMFFKMNNTIHTYRRRTISKQAHKKRKKENAWNI